MLDEGFAVEQSYLDALARGYDAGADVTDLSRLEASDVLSAWIEEHTGGLIERSAVRPSDDLRLVLQDVVLFAAPWAVEFDADLTAPRPFHAPFGMSDVATMRGSGGWAWTPVEQDGWTSVRLPYTEAFHAELVLPPEGIDPAAVDPALLARLAAQGANPGSSAEGIDLSVPSLDLTATLDLGTTLDAVGLGGLSEGPDLTGITTTEPLRVGQAIQQARLVLDEEGTVAAAVTEIGAEAASAAPPPREVVLDRPFLVRISHSETGLTLFLAAVRDPAQP